MDWSVFLYKTSYLVLLFNVHYWYDWNFVSATAFFVVYHFDSRLDYNDAATIVTWWLVRHRLCNAVNCALIQFIHLDYLIKKKIMIAMLPVH